MLQKIQQLEEEYKDKGPLYLDTTKIEFTNIEEFIKRFIFKYNPYYHTYSDLECTKSDCFAGKSRSIGDIFRIILSYDPEVRLEDVIVTMVDLVENFSSFDYNANNNKIGTLLCKDIGKRVYFRIDCQETFSKPYWYCTSQQLGMGNARIDEFGVLPEDYLTLYKEALANKAKGESMIEKESSSL